MYEGKPALSPKMEDLSRLYNLIIEKRATTVLELGCGYSTLVIAKALEENRKWFEALENKPEVRNQNVWECWSIDTNEKWIIECQTKLRCQVTFKHCECYSEGNREQMSHFYIDKPQIIPDFIYIDGPDPMQVHNWGINMPMSDDLLYLEPILIPGTTVLIDGRTNNARFLARNLQRNWKIFEDNENDITLMELDEPRLGKINACGRDILEWIENNA